MAVKFKRATKLQARLRLAITGPTGSGKTYTALEVGRHLGKKIAVIDTERGSASKYAGDVATFDAIELELFSIQNYLEAIREAEREGYDVLIIDSLTHGWSGKGGILEEVDKRGGKFDAWRWATPWQQKLVDAMLSYPGHLIATMRSKMSYEVETAEKGNGKRETTVKKLGLAPQQRDDLPYEFDVILDMDQDNNGKVNKTRCKAIRGEVITMPGKDLADKLLAWLSDGAPRDEEEKPITLVQKTAIELVMEAFDGARTHDDVKYAREIANLHRPALSRLDKEAVRDAMAAAIARAEHNLANSDSAPDDDEGDDWLDKPKEEGASPDPMPAGSTETEPGTQALGNDLPAAEKPGGASSALTTTTLTTGPSTTTSATSEQGAA